MSLRKQILIVTLLLAGAAGAWALFGGAQQSLAALTGGGVEARSGSGGERGARRGGGRMMPAAVPVTTASVASVTAATEVRAIGTGRAARAVTIFPQVPGLVSEVLFTSGERVEAGAPLVRLEDEEQSIALERARIALQTAQNTFDRQHRLTQSRAGTSVAREEAESALASARTDLAAAELALSRRTIAAPFSGVMGISEISSGDMISTSTAIASIDDRSSIEVEFHIPERHVGALAPGGAVTATTAAYGSEAFTGEIIAMDSRVDPSSRTVRMRAKLDNAADRLRPGMSFALSLVLPGEHHQAVPQIAVQWSRGGPYVWTVDNGRAKQASVTLVSRQGDLALVGGLSPDAVVIVEGVQRLREGAAIAVATASTSGEER